MENNNNITMVLSPKFKIILNFINDNVSKFLSNLDRNDDYNFSFSYIDLSDSDDQLTFIQSNKFREISEDDDLNFQDEIWTSKKRSIARVGKIVGKLTPFFRNSEIEDFVNSFKAEFRRSENIKFKIVQGQDIIRYYNGRNYYPGNGSLNKSCMRHEQCERYMNIYKQNTDVIKMVVLIDEYHEKILGRALLWKLDGEKPYLMDRIYTIDDATTSMFKKYAQKNNWLYKAYQRFDSYDIVSDDKEMFIPIKVKVRGEFQYFPYLDTMFYYNNEEKYLTNSEDDYTICPSVVKLREINGNDSGNENFVYDIINKKFIPLEDSIYCYFGDGYTHQENATFLDEYDEYAIPQKIKFSSYSKKNILSDSCVYSDNLSSFMSPNDVMKVFITNKKDSGIKISDYFLKSEYGKTYLVDSYSGDCYVMDLIIKNPDDGKTYNKEIFEEKEAKKIEKLKDRKKSNSTLQHPNPSNIFVKLKKNKHSI